MTINCIRSCSADKPSDFITELRTWKSKDYYTGHVFKGLAVGVLGDNIEINHIAREPNFYDRKSYKSSLVLFSVQVANLIELWHSLLKIEPFQYIDFLTQYRESVTNLLGRNIWTFQTDILNVVEFAGRHRVNYTHDFVEFYCDGIIIKPNSKIYNLKKHKIDCLNRLSLIDTTDYCLIGREKMKEKIIELGYSYLQILKHLNGLLSESYIADQDNITGSEHIWQGLLWCIDNLNIILQRFKERAK